MNYSFFRSESTNPQSRQAPGTQLSWFFFYHLQPYFFRYGIGLVAGCCEWSVRSRRSTARSLNMPSLAQPHMSWEALRGWGIIKLRRKVHESVSSAPRPGIILFFCSMYDHMSKNLVVLFNNYLWYVRRVPLGPKNWGFVQRSSLGYCATQNFVSPSKSQKSKELAEYALEVSSAISNII
jgi:hypothetical protein